MYRILGDFVSRAPMLTLILWGVTFSATLVNAPSWHDVWQDGEFAFLPDTAESRRAEELFRRAFPADSGPRFSETDDTVGTPVQQDPLGSNVVIVVEREDRRAGLTDRDLEFVDEVLLPKLEHVKSITPKGYRYTPIREGKPVPPEEQVIKGIVTRSDRKIGALLTSPNQKSTLVIVELTTEFLDRQNYLVIARVEELLTDPEVLEAKPAGLSLALSGSATVGRDMLRAETLSASRTDAFTKGFVVILLLLLYRAPFLALVPLATVGIAVELTLHMLRHMAGWGWIGMFTGLEVYVTVVVYGAGIDYCLFLIARYKEELDRGYDFPQAMARSVHRVGAALATSAGTSICGIGMMSFAEFGKFRQAGFAISFGLFVVLCFALTFTPAALLLFRKWAFWPDIRNERLTPRAGWLPSSSFWSRFSEQKLLETIWGGVAGVIQRRPASIFVATILVMLPFAVIGFAYQDHLSYGLLTDLPATEPSVVGARVVQKHFPAGITGPATVLVRFDRDALGRHFEGRDLSDISAAETISREVTQALESQMKTLGIVDIRNQTHPLGMMPAAQAYLESLVAGVPPGPRRALARGPIRNFAHRTYTSLKGDLAGSVMRVDLVFQDDPFARNSIGQLTVAEQAVYQALPDELRSSAEIVTLGPTAGIRDLKFSTDRDQVKIDLLVVGSVYLLLVLMLRQPAICAYLIVSVVFSYLVALGATFVVFYLRDPAGFAGIDWKIPIYLFTILIAMGEDYNILLMARVQEEQGTYGPVEGVLQALIRTGAIISSCGIIMAGTFSSLMSGTLLGMVQLGFALAFGVFLDTFVVRPILVPAYLVLLYSGRFGPLGPYLGGKPTATLRNQEPIGELAERQVPSH